jgi:hypothetical protein
MAARTIGMALAICSVGCASAPPSRSVVVGSDWPGLRLYVDTRDTDNDAERQARQQSAVDLRAALAKRHGRLVLVDTPAQADITVAIVERVIADSGSSFSLFPPRYYAARNIVRLRATVTRAGESADLMGGRWRESDAQGWVLAAQDIAAAIDTWIRTPLDSPRQATERFSAVGLIERLWGSRIADRSTAGSSRSQICVGQAESPLPGTDVRSGVIFARTKPYGPKNHGANAAASGWVTTLTISTTATTAPWTNAGGGVTCA